MQLGKAMAACVMALALAGAALAQEAPQIKKSCYLFSYFKNNGEDGLHLAWSNDGLQWKELGGGKSYLTPAVGESKLMRDPCLLLGPDGVFRLVWTTSWKGKTIGYASSRDLIHWSEQQAIPVMAHEPKCQNCWAPEVVYDKAKGDYLIFWSSTIAGQFENTHRAYCVTTKDFKSFSPARLFFDPGFNVIDETIAEHGGKYYLVHKDEREKPVKKNLRVSVGDSPEGPWGPSSEPFTRDWVEGPTLLKAGAEFIAYFDCYRDKHYGAMATSDFVHWRDLTDKLSMPRGIRHGTALEVPSAVVVRLLRPNKPVQE